ncbi:hypothetical protein Tco_0700623 [Tanacetum coccineum]
MCPGYSNRKSSLGVFLARLYRHVMKHYPHLDNGIYNVVDQVMRPLALKQTRKPRSDRGKARHSFSSTSALITMDLHLTKEMMMRMMVLLVLVPHLLPPILTPYRPLNYQRHDIPLLHNKMMIFFSSDKLSCLINLNKSMKKLEVDSNHSGKHCEGSSGRKEKRRW